MFKPDVFISSILNITPEALHRLGVFAIVLDVDNTLRCHGNVKPFFGVTSWVCLMKRAGFRLVIASNNTKNSVKPLAEKLGLPFVSFCFKPLPFGLKRACRILDVKKKILL